MERFKYPNELKGVHHIEVVIANVKQIPARLKVFTEELKKADEKDLKVKLSVLTLIDDDTSLAQIQEEFFKNIYIHVSYFDWHIFGNFTDEGSAKVIGETLGKFLNLMSLSLFID